MELIQEIDRYYLEFENWSISNPEKSIGEFLRQCDCSSEARESLRELLEFEKKFASLISTQCIPREGSEMTSNAMRGSVPLLAGKMVGNYRMIRRIGVGGMGSVWLAEQCQPVQRNVAIKLIRPGMDTESFLQRFKAEQQALAMMTHPNIAKLLDAGTMLGERPYFVMEYCPGVSITDYCNLKQLDLQQRLALFLKLCDAIQHAHRKNLIHRDIKPSNILVSEVDCEEQLRVIDFGLAKILSSDPLRPDLTLACTALGSPLWMSPEQASGPQSPCQIDIRTDIYSLGVVLFELLTGSTPIEPEKFRRASSSEIYRIIRDSVPAVPSARLAHNEKQEKEGWITECTLTKPSLWISELKNDLDWITMKAIEKEPARRYQSVAAFAEDVRRFLDGDPVVASPPQLTYQLKRRIGKHRNAVVATLAVACTLLIATTCLVWAFLSYRAGEDLRVRAEKSLEVHLREIQELDLSRPEVRFDPAQKSYLLTKLKLLDKTDFSGAPLLEAKLREAIADACSAFGMYEQSAQQLETSANIRSVELGQVHETTCQTKLKLAFELIKAHQPDSALSIAEASYESCRERFGPDHELTIGAKTALILSRIQRGEVETQFKELKSFLPVAQKSLGESHEYVLKASSGYANSLYRRHQFGEAATHSKAAFNLALAKWGPEDERTVELESINYFSMASTQSLKKSTEELGQFHARVLEKLGASHPVTLGTQRACAMILAMQAKRDEAIRLMTEHVQECEKQVGKDSLLTARAWKSLAMLQAPAGQFYDSLESFKKATKIFLMYQPESSNDVLDCFRLSGNVLARDGKNKDALKIANRYLPIAQRSIGPCSKIALDLRDLQAGCQIRLGHFDEGISSYLEMCEMAQRESGANSIAVAKQKTRLASAFLRKGDVDISIAYREDATMIFDEKHKATSRFAMRSKAHLCNVLLCNRNYDRVVQILRPQLVEMSAATPNRELSNYQNQFRVNLAEALMGLGEHAKAKEGLSAAFNNLGLKQNAPMVHADAIRLRACALLEEKKFNEAHEMLLVAKDLYEDLALDVEHAWRNERIKTALSVATNGARGDSK